MPLIASTSLPLLLTNLLGTLQTHSILQMYCFSNFNMDAIIYQHALVSTWLFAEGARHRLLTIRGISYHPHFNFMEGGGGGGVVKSSPSVVVSRSPPVGSVMWTFCIPQDL